MAAWWKATRLGLIPSAASAWCRRWAQSTSIPFRLVPQAAPKSATAWWWAAPADGHIAAKQEFAGYWEYLLDEAIFTYPAHPNWGGTGLISDRGELIGIGSLQLEREREGKAEHVNMIVPIDLLKPVLDDLRKFGRVNKPARPWLGMYSTEIENKVVVIGISAKGPAARAELKAGDVILAVNSERISSQSAFYRKLWALGPAGVDVPLTVYHEGVTFDVVLTSTDRAKLLKGPRLH
jgi:S1-C subfamily serine protease